MKQKVKLEEEVEFWQTYISNWEARHNKPVPYRAQLLLENALLKLDRQYSGKSKNLELHSNNTTLQ